MKTALSVILLMILAFPRQGNGQELVSTELSQAYLNKISSFTKSLNKKKTSEIKLAKSLFNKAHRNFLKSYHAYATVNDVFEKGNYDCLSGTYFLSRALTNLGIRHRIIETNYHIFLIAETDQGEVLMESTDRYQGFVIDKEKIEERIENYRTNRTDNGQLYLSHIKIYHEILPVQLSGLLYFNLAVESFHRNDLIASCQYLQNAWKIYDNPRIEEFKPILARSILNSGLSEKQKDNLTELLRSHAHQNLTAQAPLN
ncbi:MAG TPA: hypothetical protein VGQ59_04300 [Cyclobacteriaceae bacterium]|jgi:hypothetical protein|nr:hypothetical protein [Cyclobacteriaceae bacterium]